MFLNELKNSSNYVSMHFLNNINYDEIFSKLLRTILIFTKIFVFNAIALNQTIIYKQLLPNNDYSHTLSYIFCMSSMFSFFIKNNSL